MGNKTYCLILAGVLLCASPAFAENEDAALYSREYSQCMDGSGGTTSGMLGCIGDEYARQDAKLNTIYKKLMKTLSPERQNGLREGQRAWLKYRDAMSAFLCDPEGGTLARVTASGWVLEAVARQALLLESLFPPE